MLSWFLDTLWLFKTIGIIVSVVFFVLAVQLMIRMDYFGGMKRYGMNLVRKHPSTSDAMGAMWKKVLKHIGSKNPEEWKKAVLLADRVFDESLRVLGAKGKTVEERMQTADVESTGSLEELSGLRSVMLHALQQEQGMVSREDAKTILRAYRGVLRRMGMLS